jgi:ubiquinone biosynthesis protein COQ9
MYEQDSKLKPTFKSEMQEHVPSASPEFDYNKYRTESGADHLTY